MMAPRHVIPADTFTKLYNAGVMYEDIANHFDLVATETLRRQARRLGLPRRPRPLRGVAPTAAEVLGDKPKRPRPPVEAVALRVRIVKTLKPDVWYSTVDVANAVDIPVTRVRLAMGKLVRMGILRMHRDNLKRARMYQLDMKRPE